jgi:hypothetical protein
MLSKFTFAQRTFRYEYDSIRTMPTSFVEVEDGFVIAGAKHPNLGDSEIHLYNSHLLKINKKGEFQWAVELNDSLYNNIFAIGYDGQNLFAIELGYVEQNRSKTFFLKFDKNGILLFKKEIGTISYTSRDNLPSHLIIKKDGTILINNSEYNFTTGQTECVVYKMNKAGEILSRVAFSQDSNSCIPYDLVESADNGFVCLMNTLDFNTYLEKNYLIKFDVLGNEVWRKLIQTTDLIQTKFSICELNNEIYCAMATSYVNGGPARLSLVKYNEYGSSLFEINYANYDPPEPESFSIPKIELNRDSTGLLIFGSFAGAQTVFNPRLLFVDLSGEVKSHVDIPYQHEMGNGWSIDMSVTKDNGIALLNRNFSYLPQASNFTELVKLDCEGNFEWKDACSYVPTDLDVLIFPNSSAGKFNFQLQNLPDNTEIGVTIYDELGRLLYASSSNSTLFTIDLSFLSQAIYHYKISTNNKKYATGKLVKI